VSRNRYLETETRLWTSLGVEPRQRELRLRQLGSTVRVQEIGDGPPVLYIHGATTCGASWASLAALLPYQRCLLLDRPGTGLSERFARPVTDTAALDEAARALVPDVLDALELDTVDLVATSFGGLFAWRAALAAPERIRRIVAFGWTVGAPLGPMPLAMRLGSTPPLGRLLARMPVSRATVRRLFREIGLREAVDAGRVSDEAVDAYGALLRWTDTMRNDLDIGGRVFSRSSGFDARLLLGESERAAIASPVLFAWGERDPFGGTEIADAFVRPFPHARLELLAGVGHAPWMDDPARAAALVSEFLAG
jgi:pimeloyl-ACP methyl ester carboxylesterase